MMKAPRLGRKIKNVPGVTGHDHQGVTEKSYHAWCIFPWSKNGIVGQHGLVLVSALLRRILIITNNQSSINPKYFRS